jgi:hypothetical protein
MASSRRSTWTKAALGTALALIFTLGAHAQEVRDEFHQTYPLNATGRVMLSNINGNVQIAASDRNEVKVDAVKRAGTKERLDEARIVINSQPDSISIKTEYPSHNNTFNWGRHDNPASVDYTITVPRNARLDRITLVNGQLKIQGVTNDVRADSVNGRVEAVGLTGRVDLSTVNGPLVATFERLGANDVRLHSVNGPVTVTIPSDAETVLGASTVNGHISNDFGLRVRNHKYVGHDLRGTLGKGGTHLAMENVNGAIDVRHAADGKPLSKPTSDVGSSDEEESRL